jgi:hypothetical protein
LRTFASDLSPCAAERPADAEARLLQVILFIAFFIIHIPMVGSLTLFAATTILFIITNLADKGDLVLSSKGLHAPHSENSWQNRVFRNLLEPGNTAISCPSAINFRPIGVRRTPFGEPAPEAAAVFVLASGGPHCKGRAVLGDNYHGIHAFCTSQRFDRLHWRLRGRTGNVKGGVDCDFLTVTAAKRLEIRMRQWVDILTHDLQSRSAVGMIHRG